MDVGNIILFVIRIVSTQVIHGEIWMNRDGHALAPK